MTGTKKSVPCQVVVVVVGGFRLPVGQFQREAVKYRKEKRVSLSFLNTQRDLSLYKIIFLVKTERERD